MVARCWIQETTVILHFTGSSEIQWIGEVFLNYTDNMVDWMWGGVAERWEATKKKREWRIAEDCLALFTWLSSSIHMTIPTQSSFFSLISILSTFPLSLFVIHWHCTSCGASIFPSFLSNLCRSSAFQAHVLLLFNVIVCT